MAYTYEDLAPEIYRQRLVIEGYPRERISSEDIKRYLSQLSDELDMKKLIDPVCSKSSEYGWAGWIHWETSGAHLYAWNEHHPELFFSVDIYTCKAFDPQKAISFTEKFFAARKMAYKEF